MDCRSKVGGALHTEHLPGFVGVRYGDGVHSRVRNDMGFSACPSYRSCCFVQNTEDTSKLIVLLISQKDYEPYRVLIILGVPTVAELVLSTELVQVVDGQFVQVGDDFFGYGQLPGVIGVCYGDGVHYRGLSGLQAPVRVLYYNALAG